MQIVAIDALKYTSLASAHAAKLTSEQFTVPKLTRELIKAYAGFSVPDSELVRPYTKVATGNWGCGVFGGFIPVKALLQWVAATRSGRAVAYFPFGDKRAAKLPTLCAKWTAQRITIAQLWSALTVLCDTHSSATADQWFDELTKWFDPPSSAGSGSVGAVASTAATAMDSKQPPAANP